MASKPVADDGLVCPLHQKPTEKVCHKCPLWILVRGKDPQSEKEVDHWACSLAWLPMLIIENSQQQRATGNAIESFRNEMVKANNQTLAIAAAQAGLIPTIPLQKG